MVPAVRRYQPGPIGSLGGTGDTQKFLPYRNGKRVQRREASPMRQAGVTNYNRVTPVYKASSKRPMVVDVTEEEIRQQEIEDAIFGAKSLFGQALLCLVIILLVANVINQVIKLCG